MFFFIKDNVHKILFIACRRIQSNWGSGVDIFPLLPAPTPVLPLGPVLCFGPAVPLLRDRDRRPGGDSYPIRGQYWPLTSNQVAEDFRASISIANEDCSVKINFQGPVLPVDRCHIFSKKYPPDVSFTFCNSQKNHLFSRLLETANINVTQNKISVGTFVIECHDLLGQKKLAFNHCPKGSNLP